MIYIYNILPVVMQNLMYGFLPNHAENVIN